jgi:hypothetical protein
MDERRHPGHVKATYYLLRETVTALDEAWYELRKMADAEGRARISRSLIVETALLAAIEELKAKGAASMLANEALARLKRMRLNPESRATEP